MFLIKRKPKLKRGKSILIFRHIQHSHFLDMGYLTSCLVVFYKRLENKIQRLDFNWERQSLFLINLLQGY